MKLSLTCRSGSHYYCSEPGCECARCHYEPCVGCGESIDQDASWVKYPSGEMYHYECKPQKDNLTTGESDGK